MRTVTLSSPGWAGGHGRTIGVYSIATVEAARRRGYGAAMTARVMTDGVVAGCDIAALQASELRNAVQITTWPSNSPVQPWARSRRASMEPPSYGRGLREFGAVVRPTANPTHPAGIWMADDLAFARASDRQLEGRRGHDRADTTPAERLPELEFGGQAPELFELPEGADVR